ncbi:hypothetical protein E2320_007186 [Naja naja]|nr:hypothetical protein E2320_007186 [Naja naja]
MLTALQGRCLGSWGGYLLQPPSLSPLKLPGPGWATAAASVNIPDVMGKKVYVATPGTSCLLRSRNATILGSGRLWNSIKDATLFFRFSGLLYQEQKKDASFLRGRRREFLWNKCFLLGRCKEVFSGQQKAPNKMAKTSWGVSKPLPFPLSPVGRTYFWEASFSRNPMNVTVQQAVGRYRQKCFWGLFSLLLLRLTFIHPHPPPSFLHLLILNTHTHKALDLFYRKPNV